jgi:hypothetical protein
MASLLTRANHQSFRNAMFFVSLAAFIARSEGMMRASSLLVLFILVLGCLSCRPIILDVENAFPSKYYFRMSHELFGKYSIST